MSTVMEHHPSCRQEIEKWLIENHASFVFETRPLTDFNIEESLHNQARIGLPLVRQTAADYKIAMERGDIFPAVVAYWKAKKLVIVDGNHRLDAHKESGSSRVPVYIIEASPETITKLTYSANIRNGLPTSHEERLLQAVHLVELGSDMSDAATDLGLSRSAVASAVARTQADKRASMVGVRSWNKIVVTARQRLGSVKTDEGFKALAELVAITPLSVKDIEELVVDINRMRSAASQIEYVNRKREEFSKRIKATAGNTLRKPNLSQFTRFMSALGIINKLDVYEVARTANLTQSASEFNDYCLNTAELLMQIAEAVDEEVKKDGK